MEVSGSDGEKVIWEVADNRVFEEGKEHDEIGIQGFDFNLFDEYEEVVVREVLIEYPYLLTLIKL